MKKGLIIIGLVFVLVVIIFFISYLFKGNQDLNLPCGFNNVACQMTPLGNYYDLEEAKNWDCEKIIKDNNRKNLCLALKYGNVNYCNKMEEIIDDELTGFKKIICGAIVENNIEICKEITYDEFKQSNYYKEQLEKNRKYESEGKLVNVTAEEITEREMENIFNQQVQSCFFQVGADNKNVEACNLVEEKNEKEICLRGSS